MKQGEGLRCRKWREGCWMQKKREKVLFIEMRKEKTSKMMKQKARVNVSCTKEGLKDMIQSLRRMRTSAFDFFFGGGGIA